MRGYRPGSGNLEERITLTTITEVSEGEQCRKRERLHEGQELVMDELNHRRTCFPVDEDTNNFYIKEERG